MNVSTLVASSDSMGEQSRAGAVYAMPATPLQVRLWRLEKTAGANPAWNVAVRFRLSGTLDRDKLEQALQLLTARHEALRTSLELHEGAVVERVAPWVILPIDWCDLRAMAAEVQSAEIARLSLEHARQSLSLEQAPLFRVRILRISEDDHILLWNAHHAICDGWSVGLLARDLMECYGELLSGKTPAAQNTLDYGYYAVWLDAQRSTPEYEANRSYWKRQLRGRGEVNLPQAWRNSEPETALPVIQSILLPRSLTDRLGALAQRHDATFFHAALAAFAVWMRTQQSSPEVALGTPLSGRDQAELENVVGTFVNYAPLHFRVDGEKQYTQLLHSVRDLVSEALEHSAFRFEELLAAHENAERNGSDGNKLFSVAFICQQDFVRPISAGGLALTALPSVSSGALHPLTVFMVERADGWRLSCEVDNRNVSAVAGRAMLEAFERLLTIAALHSDEPVTLLATRAGCALPAVPVHAGIGGTSESIENGSSLVPRDPVRIPATEFQRRFWQLDGMNPGDASFHIRIRLELNGPLQISALRSALEKLTLRHEILRTTFEEKDGRIWQVVHPQLPLDFQLLESSSSASGPEQQIANQAVLDAEGTARFSLTAGPLFRTRLLKLEESRHWLAITLSHGIVDGWATGLFLDQLQKLYAECLLGTGDAIEAVASVQFADYAEAEHAMLAGPEKERRLTWWRENLQGVWEPLALPRDLQNSSESEGDVAAGMEAVPLAPAVISAAKKFAREHQTTVYAVFGALFQALLLRYSGQENVLFLTPHANRTGNTETILGPLADPICLTGHVDEHTTFLELVTRFSRQSMDAMENSLPLNIVTPLVDMRVSDGYHPLNQIIFFYQRAFVHDMQWKDLRVQSLPDTPSVTGSEWQLGVVERGDGIVLEFLYDSTLYSRPTIQMAAHHFTRLLTHAIAEPTKALSRIEILSPEELKRSPNAAALPVLQRILTHAEKNAADRISKAAPVTADAAVPRPVLSSAEHNILEIWQQLFKVEDITPESNFFDLGGHSLLLARLQIAMKKKFDVQLAAAEVFRHPTVATLAVWLEKAKAAVKQNVPEEHAAWMSNSRIVPIQPSGAGRSIFVISQSMIFRTLAAELGMAQPVYAVQMLQQDEAALGSMSYEDLIDFYVRLIREVQPIGPYRVAGWCVSAWIAYGVARQLEKLGSQVEMLMVVDAWAPGYWSHQSLLRRKLMLAMYNLQRSRWLSIQRRDSVTPGSEPSIRLHGLTLVMQKLLARLHRAPATAEQIEEGRRDSLLQKIAGHASESGPLQGRILVFRSEQEPVGPLLSPNMGWTDLVGRPVEAESLPGDHHQIFDLPGARMMAQSARKLFGVDPSGQVASDGKSSGDPLPSAIQNSPMVEA